MDVLSLYWLAGILEGEGSFMKGPPSRSYSPIIHVEMTDEDVVAKIAELLGSSYRKARNRNPGVWKQSYVLRVNGAKAVEIMKLLYPLMGKRRKTQIDAGLACYRQVRRQLSDDEVREIRKLLALGVTHQKIEEQFKIGRTTVTNIHLGYRRTRI